MIQLGLTGSIGMGKSTVARMFAEQGAPVFDADAAVHALYAKGGAGVAAVGVEFPQAIRDGAVDRAELSRLVMNDPAAFRRLEQVVHPLVAQANADFVAAQRQAGAQVIVFDVPLLYENRGAARFDKVAVVSAPADMQRARVLARPGMTEEKFEGILARQMPDAEKRTRADFVIDTGCPLEETRAQVRAILDALREHD